jgi:Tfp pilus assembly protein PilN
VRAVNLIPSEQRRGSVNLSGRSGGAAYVVVGLILGLAVMAVLYGKADHEIGAKQAEATRLSAEAQQAQSEASRLAPYTSFVALREERLKAVQELANTRFDWAHAMHELGRVVPAQAALSTVAGTVGATTVSTGAAAPAAASASKSVASATPAGSTPSFTIAGCATSQSTVALTMNRLRLIDGVSEVSLQSSSKGGEAGGAGCPAGAPSFSMQVSFDALPTPTVKSPSEPATSSASDSTGGASKGRKGVSLR